MRPLTPAASRKLWLGLGLVIIVLGGILIFGRGTAARLYHSITSQASRAGAYVASYDFFSGAPAQKPVKTRISPADRMVEVLVPAGEFWMGADDQQASVNKPRHAVYLDAYWIDQTTVTNRMYALCVQAKKCDPPISPEMGYGNPLYANYPVVYVTWFQAKKYCAWAGRRLPTEAEWEKAARGDDERAYPWGNSAPSPGLANYDQHFGSLLPAGRYPAGASPYGALNMAGNVRQWVADWFNEGYYARSPYKNPPGPQIGTLKSLRGGSYLDNAAEIRVFNRFAHDPASPGVNRGFRCARRKP